MVNAQEWLDSNYPLNKRNEITILNISKKQESSSDKKLTGSLTLVGFNNLTELDCSFNNLTNLDLSNCSSLTKLTCYLNNLTNLDLSSCAGLTELDCSFNNLTNLDLSNCSSLTKLTCYYNQLTELDLSNCASSIKLKCSDNKFTDLNSFVFFNPETIKFLDLSNNEIKGIDLKFFSTLINLEVLYIQGNYFCGSLEPLKNLTKLKRLDIRENELTNGLEYLPDLEYFIFSENTEIEEKLKKHKGFFVRNVGINEFKKWKKHNDRLILLKLLKQLEEEKEWLIKRNSDLETLIAESESLIKFERSQIFHDYLAFFSEEEGKALQELITVHKSYIVAKKHKEKVDELYEQIYTLRKQLKTKLGSNFIEAVEKILTKFEQLYQREWDLQQQLAEKELVIERKKVVEEGIKQVNISLINNSTYNINHIKNNYSGKFISEDGSNMLIGSQQFGDHTHIGNTATKRTRRGSWEERESSKKAREENTLDHGFIEEITKELVANLEVSPK